MMPWRTVHFSDLLFVHIKKINKKGGKGIMNKVEISGKATRNAEIKRNGESVVAKFTIAVPRPLTKEQKQKAEAEGKPTADFVPCTAFGKKAEFCENVKQGTGWLVTGRIQTGSYTNKDGVKVYTMELAVEDIEYPPFNQPLGSGQQGGQTPPQAPVQQAQGQQAPQQAQGQQTPQQAQGQQAPIQQAPANQEFTPIPDDIMDDADLPWN